MELITRDNITQRQPMSSSRNRVLNGKLKKRNESYLSIAQLGGYRESFEYQRQRYTTLTNEQQQADFVCKEHEFLSKTYIATRGGDRVTVSYERSNYSFQRQQSTRHRQDNSQGLWSSLMIMLGLKNN